MIKAEQLSTTQILPVTQEIEKQEIATIEVLPGDKGMMWVCNRMDNVREYYDNAIATKTCNHDMLVALIENSLKELPKSVTKMEVWQTLLLS